MSKVFKGLTPEQVDGLNDLMEGKEQNNDGCVRKFMSCMQRIEEVFWPTDNRRALVEVKMLHTNWVFRKTASHDENDLFMLIRTLDT